jgi:cyclophilin family peptidyl-prolyl cis-trans isomerase
MNNTDSPSDFGITHQIRINFLAQLRCKLFGIIQATVTKFFRKNYCSGHNRARQRPATSLINPGNPRDAGSAQFFFVTKSASPIHPIGILG